ncbi:hypothetical protein CRG98_014043 [Punica granatum]|uniref:Uncharacterized protein n=1 Tax=Punica granatum TaxID=22663 RepID=A0A2I0KBL9_PUNGR|nr:hypothetical protein CRG98_014043 [Punica granatum]
MWLILSASPTFSTAATESPPPIMFFDRHTSVPTANLSNSNTPMGPFQMMVWVASRASLNVLMLSGANLSAITTSVGSNRETPFALAFSRRDVARPNLSSSTRDEPTERPCAL